VLVIDCNRTCYDLLVTGIHQNSGARKRALFHHEDTGQVRGERIGTNLSQFFRREHRPSAMFTEDVWLTPREPREYQA